MGNRIKVPADDTSQPPTQPLPTEIELITGGKVVAYYGKKKQVTFANLQAFGDAHGVDPSDIASWLNAR